MELKFNVTGEARKAFVAEVGAIMGITAVYQGAPRFGYAVKNVVIDRNGALIWDERTDNETIRSLLTGLAQRGYAAEGQNDILVELDTDDNPAFEDLRLTMEEELGVPTRRENWQGENGMRESDVPEPEDDAPPADSPAADRLVIEMPLDGFTPDKLENLKRLVESKASLLKKALGLEKLPIQVGTDKIGFPWFKGDLDADTINAYAKFIAALCRTAREKTRVTAKAQDAYPNEKFALRVYLLGLGLIGKEYTLCRKLLLQNLSGNSAFRYGPPEKNAATPPGAASPEAGASAPEAEPAPESGSVAPTAEAKPESLITDEGE